LFLIAPVNAQLTYNLHKSTSSDYRPS